MPMTAELQRAESSEDGFEVLALVREKAPWTFSHTMYLGYLPPVAHLISLMIRTAS